MVFAMYILMLFLSTYTCITIKSPLSISVSQCLAASASPGNLLAVQILMPHPRLNDSETLWVGPRDLFVDRPSR